MKLGPLLLGLAAAALLLLARRPERPRMEYTLDDQGLVTLKPGVSTVTLAPATMDAWRALVASWPEPLPVKASYRPEGGAAKSKHKTGEALDIELPLNARPGKLGAIQWRREFVAAAQRAGFTAFGLGYGTIHIDTGPARWWAYQGGDVVGYPGKLAPNLADRVPPEFAAAGNKVPDLTGLACAATRPLLSGSLTSSSSAPPWCSAASSSPAGAPLARRPWAGS